MNEINRVNDWNRVGGTNREPYDAANQDRALNMASEELMPGLVHRIYREELLGMVPEAGLSLKQTRVILAVLEGWGHRSALAREMGVSCQAIHISYRRAITKLKKCLSKRAQRLIE
jgi:DNA-directed RNA polymerase specialized sigma24 family protein